MPLTSLLGLPGAPVPAANVLIRTEQFPQISRHQLLDAADGMAAALHSLGVRPGDLVCISAEDGAASVVATLGAWALRAVPTLVSHRLTEQELAFVLSDSAATAVVTDDGDQRRLNGVPRMSTSEVDQILVAGGNQPFASTSWDEQGDDPVMLVQFTSGSTGRPKGVVHRRSGIAALARTTGPLYRLQPQDRVLSAAKLSFGYGFGNSTLLPWQVGASGCLISRDVDVFTYSEAIERFRPTVLAAVPRLWLGLLAAHELGRGCDLSSVRSGISAGEFLPPAVAARVRDELGIPVSDGLGGTETLHIFMARGPGAAASFPLDGVELTLRDDDGRPLTGPATGRLHVRSAVVADGYRQRPEETAATFADGGVYPGDLCRRDETGGYEWLSRTDDMLLLGGMRIAPREIEAVAAAVPSVQECLVVPHTTADGLQDAVLHMVPADGAEDRVVQEVRAALVAQLPKQRIPGYLRVVPALPRTSTGKPARSRLRAEAGREVSGLKLRAIVSREIPERRVVILPCAGGAAFTYAPMADSVPEGVALYSADVQDPPANDLTDLVTRWGLLLHSVVDRGDLVVGHSFGAAVLARLLVTDPEALRGAHPVLVAPPSGEPVPEGDLAEWLADRGLIPDAATLDGAMLTLLADRFRRDAHLLTGAPDGLPAGQPATVVVGTRDRVIDLRQAHNLIGDPSCQRVLELPGGDHHLLTTDTRGFFDLVLGHMTAGASQEQGGI